jgi:hypothetical protein
MIGPAKQARPTSSTPAIRRTPRARSWARRAESLTECAYSSAHRESAPLADLVEEDVRNALQRVTASEHAATASVDETERTSITSTTENPPARIPPPSKHQLALMIWLCVFPTLTAINLVFGDWLRTMSPVLRTFVLATIAVPIVIYGLMPHLHRLSLRLLTSGRVS